MPSPICQVKEGAGSYQSTTNGVDVSASASITIKLADITDVNSWSIQCVSTDDTLSASTITASLVVDSVLRTATFTAPASGKALIFRSVVNGGVDVNGRTQASYSTTFGIFTLTAGGRRVMAANQTIEGNASYGWSTDFNDLVRDVIEFPAGLAAGDMFYYDGSTLQKVPGTKTNGYGPLLVAGVPTWSAISGGSPGGSTGEVQYNNAGAFGGATNFKAGANYCQLGPTGTSTGYYRVTVGTGANVTDTPVLVARDTTYGTDSTLIQFDSANQRYIYGPNGTTGNSRFIGYAAEIYGQNIVRFVNKSGSGYFGAFDQSSSDFVAFGATPATTGNTRFANATVGARFRNAANSADMTVWETNSSNKLFLGSDATFTGNVVPELALAATTAIQAVFNGATAFYITTSGVGVGYQNINVGIYGGASTFPAVGGGVGVLAIGNAGTVPSSNPTGGGVLYAEGGAGKWRGSGGTITTFGPAEPHCPKCGTDVGVSQSENDLFGEELIHCHACEIRTGNGVVRHFADFFERYVA